MKITPHLFEAFLKCPTKCWLRSQGEPSTGNEYAEWFRSQNEAYRVEGTKRLAASVPPDDCVTNPAETENPKTAKWRFAIDFLAHGQNAESTIHAVERVRSEGRGKAATFIPIRFIFTNKLTRDDKLLVAFDDLVLSDLLGRGSGVGKIIHGDNHATLKVKTSALANEVRKRIEGISAMLVSPSPPDLVLNRHCGECEFQFRCRQKAIEKDDLSLLSGMSEKERKQLHSKGIFTVTQLSYTFRPRRRPKRMRDKKERYHHSLKALAIREKKIHIVGTPELKIDGTPVYLDVEGLPDRDFYYLIGMRVKNAEAVVQHNFWSDDFEGEKKSWSDFLAVLAVIDRPVIVHYGSYETAFLRKMSERYGEPPEGSPSTTAIKSAFNLLSFFFGQLYFPTYSNGLKEIGAWLGCKWSRGVRSGLDSITWRTDWEGSRDEALKQTLVTYNLEDCINLERLTTTSVRICNRDSRAILVEGTELQVALDDKSPSWESRWGRFSSPIADFEIINAAARWDRQRDKVYIRTDESFKPTTKQKSNPRREPRINKDVICNGLKCCPMCQSNSDTRYCRRRTKILYDVRFIRFGVKRWVVKYHFRVYWCPSCHKCFGLPVEFWPMSTYGRNLVSLVVFETIDLRVPQSTVRQSLNRLFGLGLHNSVVNGFKSRAAKYYAETRLEILAQMVQGTLIHADETPIVLKNGQGYVWVFASLHHVAYFYAESRQGDFVQHLLKDFRGVLVSDFYSAYDSLSCLQQKCLIHLMRDLNDAVLDSPYDDELKLIVTRFGELLRNMVDTIDRRGLKRRFLRKHLIGVRRFYRQIANGDYHSDAALRCKERFEKNRDKLFTFLSRDGVSWNNNNAEHAIKAFAKLRRTIVGLSTAKGIEEYLVLLSICQTCKYSGLDFLDFLRSGEKGIHAFAESKERRRGRKAEDLETPATG